MGLLYIDIRAQYRLTLGLRFGAGRVYRMLVTNDIISKILDLIDQGTVVVPYFSYIYGYSDIELGCLSREI